MFAVNSCFQCFLQASLEITLFYTTSGGQIILCHVTDLTMSQFWSLISLSFRNLLLNTLQSRNVGVMSVRQYKGRHLRKMHFKFLTRRIKY